MPGSSRLAAALTVTMPELASVARDFVAHRAAKTAAPQSHVAHDRSPSDGNASIVTHRSDSGGQVNPGRVDSLINGAVSIIVYLDAHVDVINGDKSRR